MPAMNVLVLSFCHIYPLIILGSIPRSCIAGSKAIHVLMSPLHGLEGAIPSHIHQYKILVVPNYPHFANLIGFKKSFFINILKIILGPKHLFLAFSGWFLIIRKHGSSGEKQKDSRDFHSFIKSCEFLRKLSHLPSSRWNW